MGRNSQKKALEIAKYLNMVTVADDSGLMVEALEGAPGVYSARYAGEDSNDLKNNQKLIRELSNKENKKAKFVSVISVAKPNGEVYSFRGEVHGIIIEKARGENGFGFDEIFELSNGKTLAEISTIEKLKLSPRKKALDMANRYLMKFKTEN